MAAQKKRKKTTSKKPAAQWPRKIIKWSIAAFAVLALLGLLFFFSVKWGAFGPLPSKSDLAKIQNNTASLIYSEEGALLGKVFKVNRTQLSINEVPKPVIEALVATEDVRFYQHHGVDYRSLGRVLIKSLLLQDRSAGGGSTLTQQLAKNLFGRKDFAFLTLPVNKTKEIILAQRLESLYSKEEILELYLNTVSFSENTYGLNTGALRFFNKQPRDLKLEEGAVLIGLLKANTYYNPRLNPERALARRNVVLEQMARYNYLSPAQADSLQEQPLALNYTNLVSSNKAAYFTYQVKQEAKKILENTVKPDGGNYDLTMDGLRIFTTLSEPIQAAAEASLQDYLEKLQKLFNRHWRGSSPWHGNPQVFQQALESSRSFKHLKARFNQEDSINYYLNRKHRVEVYHPEGDSIFEFSIRDSVAYYLNLLRAGSVAINPQNGAVKAWVGGRNFRWMPYDHVLAKRQVASTFKPLVFAAAIEQGADPCDYVAAERRKYPQYDNWAPRNYDQEYKGFFTMAGALKKSVNTVTVKTLMETGVDETRALAEKMGISSQLPRNPSLALGTASLSLLEIIRAYACFANGGHRVEPYLISRIENTRGEVIYQKETIAPQRVLDKRTAELMNAMLQKVVDEGTARALRSRFGLPNALAGKTGTAQNYSDGWFVGYNPQLVMGVWVGGITPAIRFKSGTYGSGSAMALPVFAATWQKLNKQTDLHDYTSAGFEKLPEDWAKMLDCKDYREPNFMDKVKGLFKRKPGEEVDAEEEEKPGFFKRLFGGGKSKN